MERRTTYRPEGFRDVNTYLVLRRGAANGLVAFMKNAFGATERMMMREPDGRLAHGELQVGDSVVELGEGQGGFETRVALHLFVEDVDLVHRRALAAGGKELGAPVDQVYGERSSAVEDPCGNHWYIARLIANSRS